MSISQITVYKECLLKKILEEAKIFVHFFQSIEMVLVALHGWVVQYGLLYLFTTWWQLQVPHTHTVRGSCSHRSKTPIQRV